MCERSRSSTRQTGGQTDYQIHKIQSFSVQMSFGSAGYKTGATFEALKCTSQIMKQLSQLKEEVHECVCECMCACLPPRVHSSGYDKAEVSHSLGCSDDSTLLQLGGRPKSAVAGYLPITQIHINSTLHMPSGKR